MTTAEQIAEDILTRFFAETPEKETLPAKEARLAALIAARTQPLEDALRDLLAAFKRYEMDVDQSPTSEHRDMMKRATATLAATAKGA